MSNYRLQGWFSIPSGSLTRCLVLCAAAAVVALAADEASRTDAIFASFAAPSGSPGCAAGVVRQGRTLYAKGHGLASLEHPVAISPQTTFYMASVSKQFLAFAVLLAEQQGKLSLDDPIGRHVPDLPSHTAAVTLRQLLHHTGGVRDYLMLGSLAGVSDDHVWTERGAVRAIARQKALNFAPGSEHLYSNSGYVLLSLAVQKAVGARLDAWMKQYAWTHLGMQASRWQHDHNDPVPHRAAGYRRDGSSWKIANSMLDTVGDGGMYSSLEDMLRWAAHFDQPKPGSGPLLDRMATPGALNGGKPVPGGYGMGLARGSYRGLETVGHGGALAGYRTYLFRIPSRQFTVVCLCNNASADPGALVRKIADVWLEADFKSPAPDAAAASAPKPPTLSVPSAEQRASLAGEWHSAELDATYRIRDVEGKLLLESGSAPPMELQRTDNGRYRPIRIPLHLELRGADVLVLDAGRVRDIEFRKK